MEIYYTIEYNSKNKTWIVFKNTEGLRSFNFCGIYKGTKKECKEYLKENNLKESKVR